MKQTYTQVYRAFDIDAEIDTIDGVVHLTRLSIGIRNQLKRIRIAPDAFTSVDFKTASRAIDAGFEMAQRTIDTLLDAHR